MSKIKEVSAGIIISRVEDNKRLFLLVRSFGRFWNFPKGHVEKGETILEAAKREVKEEVDISSSELDFKWGTESHTTEAFKKGKKIDIFFVAETNKKNIILPISPELGYPEHDKYIWADYNECKSLVNERIGRAIDWAQGKINGK